MVVAHEQGPQVDQFEIFYVETEPRLRRAFVAAFGAVRGREATVEALSYAWEHFDDVRIMEHPLAYLFPVGQTCTGDRRPRLLFPAAADARTAAADARMPWIEPGLPEALSRLSEHQRVAVVLAHGFGWTHREIADVLDVATSTVQNHVERGWRYLRAALEVETL